MQKQRCRWAEASDLYRQYHDEEWGRAQRDENKLFEKICLEGQQAGLSWIIVLQKRADYRRAFHDFDPVKIAAMTDKDIDALMATGKLINHRKKLQSIVANARALLAMHAKGESLSRLLWDLVGNKTHVNNVPELGAVPSQTPTSQVMAKILKQRGFSFIGPVSCYAFMQAMGMVDDHHNSCFCKGHNELGR